jgi:hypothetical protein
MARPKSLKTVGREKLPGIKPAYFYFHDIEKRRIKLRHLAEGVAKDTPRDCIADNAGFVIHLKLLFDFLQNDRTVHFFLLKYYPAWFGTFKHYELIIPALPEGAEKEADPENIDAPFFNDPRKPFFQSWHDLCRGFCQHLKNSFNGFEEFIIQEEEASRTTSNKAYTQKEIRKKLGIPPRTFRDRYSKGYYKGAFQKKGKGQWFFIPAKAQNQGETGIKLLELFLN